MRDGKIKHFSFLLSLAASLSLVLLASWTSRANAEESVEYQLGTVDGLLKACTHRADSQAEAEYHFGSCMGFIRGVRMAFETLAAANGKQFVCPPDDVQNVEIWSAIVAELRQGTAKPDGASAIVVIEALEKNFPCPASAAASPASQVGDWKLTQDATQCAARKVAPTGTSLNFTYEPGNGIAVIATSPKWNGKVRKGQNYRLRVTFDQNQPIELTGGASIEVPQAGIGYIGVAPAVDPFLQQLASSGTLKLFVEGQPVEEFALEGSDDISRSLRAWPARLQAG